MKSIIISQSELKKLQDLSSKIYQKGYSIKEDQINKLGAKLKSINTNQKVLNNFLYQIKALKIKTDFNSNLADRLGQVLTGKNGYGGTLVTTCLPIEKNRFLWRDTIKLNSIEKIWAITYDNIPDIDQEFVKTFTQYVILCCNKESISDLFAIFIIYRLHQYIKSFNRKSRNRITKPSNRGIGTKS